MEIVRNADGTLVVPVEQERHHDSDDDDGQADGEPAARDASRPTTRVLHPGEGGYDEALAEWDRSRTPIANRPSRPRPAAQEAMHLVHEVATSPDHAVAPAVEGARTIPKRAARRCATCSSAACVRSKASRPRSRRPRAATRFPRTRRRRSSARCSPSSIPDRDRWCRHPRAGGGQHPRSAADPSVGFARSEHRRSGMRIESSVTTLSWIPSEAVTGVNKGAFESASPTTTTRRPT